MRFSFLGRASVLLGCLGMLDPARAAGLTVTVQQGSSITIEGNWYSNGFSVDGTSLPNTSTDYTGSVTLPDTSAVTFSVSSYDAGYGVSSGTLYFVPTAGSSQIIAELTYSASNSGVIGTMTATVVDSTAGSLGTVPGGTGSGQIGVIGDTLSFDEPYWLQTFTVARPEANITSSSGNDLSALDQTLYPVFDGGTLSGSASQTVSDDFTVTANGGGIDAAGNALVFTGTLTNANGVATPGYLVIENSGSGGYVFLNPSVANTFSGGFQVQPGATLQIASGDALGTGTLQLIGTATTPAVFSVTGSTTVSNPIQVSGDPTYAVASGQTVTQTGAITDVSGSPGDIVKTGAGTLVLAPATSGANTYSGGTQIQQGTLQAGIADALPIGGDVGVSSGATLDLNGYDQSIGSLTGAGDITLGGATLTLSNASGILSGAISGSGGIAVTGGTQTFSGVNAYTGPTVVGSGAALALSGAGSIAASSALTNGGTFDITGASGNVGVSNYVQTSGATLTMRTAAASGQQLQVTGTAALAGTLDLVASAGSYQAGRYALISSSGALSGSFATLASNLSSYTSLAYRLVYDANNAYLVLAPQLSGTQSSVDQLASALQTPFMLQTAILNGNLDNDCTLFDQHGVCVGVGGRYTAIDSSGPHQSNASVVGAYRVDDHVRVGAWADQELSEQLHTTQLKSDNDNPMLGVWGVWTQHPGEQGYTVRVAAGYGDQTLDISRAATAGAEPGSGSSKLTTQGASAILAYDQPVAHGWVVSPYAGLRYTKTSLGAYAEQASASVADPLSYGRLNQEMTTALAGLRFAGQVVGSIEANASIGVEQDLDSRCGAVSATNGNISDANGAGLTAVPLTSDLRRTRPVASLGASYDLGHAQQIGVSVAYAQQPFGTAGATTAQVRYTAGF